jgi:DNA-binding winged helix-turn-helix (wHTH) protein
MRFKIGALFVDDRTLHVCVAGTTIPTAPKVAELLAVLCESDGEFVSKEALIARLWPDGYADDATLWQKIYLLRNLLRPHLGDGAVETLPRRGYRLSAPVQRVSAEFVNAPPARVRPPFFWRPLASAVACAVATAFIVHAVAQPRAASTAALGSAALRAVNLGQHFLRERTMTGLNKATENFQTAIRLQPGDAAGYAGASEAYSLRTRYGTRARDEFAARALALGSRSVQLDPGSPAARAAFALALYTQAQFSRAGITGERAVQADRAFRTAIALGSSYAPVRLYYGEFLLERGDINGSSAQLRRAVDLDPSLGIASVIAAQVDYLRGDPRSTIREATEALGFGTSDKWDALLMLGLGYEGTHQHAAALQAFRQLERYGPGMGAAGMAYVEAQAGSAQRAHILLKKALRNVDCDCGDFWLTVALTQLKLGDRRAAGTSLLRMRKDPYASARLARDPRLASLSSSMQ